MVWVVAGTGAQDSGRGGASPPLAWRRASARQPKAGRKTLMKIAAKIAEVMTPLMLAPSA